MTTPTHCSKPMRRSETKKDHPWWCSMCGEYLDRAQTLTINGDDECWPDEFKARADKIKLRLAGPVAPQVTDCTDDTVFHPGNRLFRISDDGISIDGSKIEESEVETHSDPIHDARGVKIGIVPLRPWATGEFKTKDGRMFRGKKMDPGAGWEIEETRWIDPSAAVGDSLDEIASTFGTKRIPATTPSLTPAIFRGVPFPNVPPFGLQPGFKTQKTPRSGIVLAIHHDMTDEEIREAERDIPCHVRYIWARVSKEDFEAL